MEQTTSNSENVSRRAINLVFAAVIAAAAIGFLVGIDYGVPHHDVDPPLPTRFIETGGERTILPAMTYAEIGQADIGPTRHLRSSFDALRPASPNPDIVINLAPDDKRESLALRGERRAYNGAPPIIPHRVDQLSNTACLTCHGEGFRLQSRSARQLPHPYYENCTQCHAPPPPDVIQLTEFRANSFDGIAAPFEGERAWLGAPPVVPHSTWMRENCLACHGTNGWKGMETTHPWRDNCLQCHAPSSTLDLRPSTMNQVDLLPPIEVADQ